MKAQPNESTDHYEFLPAALEVQETPPSPIGRAITWVIVVFFSLTLVWALLGHIDIVATAQGKIIPTGKSKTIQPLETSVIKAIHVAEGQNVRQGDVLIELDPALKQADLGRLEKEAASLRAKKARLMSLMAAIEKPASVFRFQHPNDQSTALSLFEEKLAKNQYHEHNTRLAQLKALYQERVSAKRNVQAQVKKLTMVLPIIEKRASSLQGLAEQKLVSEVEYLEAEQQRIEAVQDLESQQYQLTALGASLREAKQQQVLVRAEFTRQVLGEMSEVQQALKNVQQELMKARVLTKLQTLTSPIDGVVQQLAVNTIGGVVTPAQPLMVIVPDNQVLEVEAMLPNKDIGFVYEGQAAEIKIEAFPFIKYGVINGLVETISNDAVEQEDVGLVYTTQVSMENNQMNVNGRVVNLSPEMVVTVEVKTGQWRLIEYFLASLLRYRDESLGER